VGNQIQKVELTPQGILTTTLGYNSSKPHAVTHLNGSQKFWYDANGNMTRRIDEDEKDWDYAWTIENQLKQATTTGDERYLHL
jgi:YD repeat-containing protein